MRRSLRRFAGARGGTTAVEFALISPVLLALLFGTFEYARYLWTVNALQQTATLTARCMGLQALDAPGQPGCATSAGYSAAKASAFAEALGGGYGLALADSNLTLDHAASCAGLGDFSQASIAYAFTTVMPQILPSMAQGYTIRATACFPNQS